MRAHDLVTLSERAANHATELLERGVADSVAREQTLPPARDETLLEEQGQVLACVRLRASRERTQFLDGALLLEQGLEQRQAGGVAERAKPLSDKLEGLA